MDCRTGEIHSFMDKEELEAAQKLMMEDSSRRLLELSGEQVKMLEPLDPSARKKKMRNHACPCGSGKKLKKCCLYKHV